MNERLALIDHRPCTLNYDPTTQCFCLVQEVCGGDPAVVELHETQARIVAEELLRACAKFQQQDSLPYGNSH